MTYVWSRHALWDRLPDPTRTLLSREQLEKRLEERSYVVSGVKADGFEHHLIWDDFKHRLIDIPVDKNDGTIITIMPVRYQVDYPLWIISEAMSIWLTPEEENCSIPETIKTEEAQIWLTKTWFDESGYVQNRALTILLRWPVFDFDDISHMLRDAKFREIMHDTIVRIEDTLLRWTKGDTPVITIKTPQSETVIPLDFFRQTP